jgi:RimK family alpha-L-glutamate ligase
MRIGVLAAEEGWHFQDLVRVANENAEKQYDLRSLSFGQLSAELTGGMPNQRFSCEHEDLGGLGRLIVRTMTAGSLQQIVFRMDLLNRLEAAGVQIFNSPRAMEISVDKYLSLAMLADAGLAVPDTFVAQTVDDGLEYFDRLGGKVIYKPLFGSIGNGICLIQDRAEAQSFFQNQVRSGEVLYLQKFIDHGDSDLRVLVIGDQTIAMQRKRPGHWLTNIAQGATGFSVTPSPQQRDIAMAACRAVGCRIAGVDLLQDSRTGQDVVVDVNAAPGWQALSAVSGIDIAALILKEVAAG